MQVNRQPQYIHRLVQQSKVKDTTVYDTALITSVPVVFVVVEPYQGRPTVWSMLFSFRMSTSQDLMY